MGVGAAACSRSTARMRDWVIDFASHPTMEEVLAIMESTRGAADTPGATHESILADLAADRR